MADLAALRAEFIERFAVAPRFFRAPGRVNLIGEHTDYNGGFAMPAAIGFDTTVAAAARADRRLRVHSTNFSETLEAPLPEAGAAMTQRNRGAHWLNYLLGVAGSLAQHGVRLRGADLLVHGEVPIGAGLSSSAALEVAAALALSTLAEHPLEPVTLARLCQRAENDYVGMRCGIMDQMASACGRAGHVLCIDCRSLDYELLPFGPGAAGDRPAVRLVICNTMVHHQLFASEYNRRRQQCEQAIRQLARLVPGLTALRDISSAVLRAHRTGLDALLYRRCLHVVTENERVQAAAAALAASDLATFGQLMRASHRSLRDDYQVSCEELDLMVQLADPIEGVYGARMTGGGFGGCTVNLVRADAVRTFQSQIAARYAQATGHRPEIYVCEAADGAAQIGHWPDAQPRQSA